MLQPHVSLDILPNTWHARSGGSETKQGRCRGCRNSGVSPRSCAARGGGASCCCARENEQGKKKGRRLEFSGRHPWGELLLGAGSSLRDGEDELGEGSRCSTLLGKKGVAAGMPSAGSRGPAMGERPAPWEEGSRAPCALGKKAPCCAWGKKPGRKMLWRLKEMEGWECKTAKDKGEGSVFIEKP